MLARFLFLLLLSLPLQAGAATVNLRPVGICTAAGCATPSFRRSYLKWIWAQADIDVRVLKAVSSDMLAIDTDAYGDLDATDALYDFAFWQVDRGTRPGTVYMGFAAPLAGRTVGLAFVNAPGLALYPYGIAEALGGRYGAAVVAHELGHILGAHHDTGTSLMSPILTRSDYDDRHFLPAIDKGVFDLVRNSPLVTSAVQVDDAAPVPLPPTAPALAAALLFLALRTRSRRS